MSLITKIQHRNDEPGEFTGRAERTYEDTIRLIENYPWQQQKEHFAVSPTGPSVTIESGLGDYLKLAPYYEGKFVLYYLDATGHLYTKSFPDLHGAFPFIQSFFEQRLDPGDFKLEKYWTRGKAIHFKDMDFHYTPQKTGILVTIALVGAFCIFQLIAITGLYIAAPIPTPQAYILLPIFVLVPLVFIGKFVQFINCYLVARDKELILSRGNDVFYYGQAGSPQQFDKKDIKEILVYNSYGRRLEIDGFARIEMQSPDEPYIYIPYMVLHAAELKAKLAGYPQRNKTSLFPFIPLSASAPS